MEASNQAPTRSAPSLETWETAALISGAAVLIGSFLPWISITGSDIGSGVADINWSAWSNALNLFPIATLVVLAVVLVTAQLALTRFTSTVTPERVGPFTWHELRLTVGALATLTTLTYLVRSFPDDEVGKGAGLYIVTLGAIGLLVAAVMERKAVSAPGDSSSAAVRAANPGDWVIMAAGAAVVIGSFLPVYDDGFESVSAWRQGMFPLYLIPVILGVAMAVQVALTTLRGMRIPARILGLEWRKVHLALGFYAAFVMLGFLIGKFYFTIEGETVPDPDKGAGFWIMLIAGIGLAVGAILREREPTPGGSAATPAATPPASPEQQPAPPTQAQPPERPERPPPSGPPVE